jgi:hypothetical protein
MLRNVFIACGLSMLQLRFENHRRQNQPPRDAHRMRLRQSVGVSPVSFLNAAAKAVWEE